MWHAVRQGEGTLQGWWNASQSSGLRSNAFETVGKRYLPCGTVGGQPTVVLHVVYDTRSAALFADDAGMVLRGFSCTAIPLNVPSCATKSALANLVVETYWIHHTWA